MSYTYTPLPPPVVAPRDPNFLYPPDAEAIAKSLMAQTTPQAGPTEIQGVQAIPPVPNIYPDGRVYILLNFTMTLPVTNSMGRAANVSVPFSEVAGLLLDYATASPAHVFKFIAESVGQDAWLGDVE